jgi:predicted sulfurtransferase
MTEAKDLRARLRAEILTLTAARGQGKSICPSEAARAVRPEDWNRFMTETRRVAVQMAEAGEIEILRKGKPVAPDEVRGVIRLRRPVT